MCKFAAAPLAVYPRWRGEHPPAPRSRHHSPGLSPLARGTPHISKDNFLRSRFIPAGAGNTYQIESRSVMSAVYPRWRGEHIRERLNKNIGRGLSPLARGTRCIFAVIVRLGRFIPAGAGNTIVCKFAAAPLAVYPRWRGEHPPAPRSRHHSPGLSPLARGTPHISKDNFLRSRFIPAGAGNTYQIESRSVMSAVYPRWRGEHVVYSLSSSDWAGLSPLARGTH